jgi:predicted 3-demethylubiquinone-9 3-methyltransferase (glyoxalase superfamily)
MQKIIPCLWFDRQAEEAINLYTTIFPNSQIGAVSHYGDNMPLPKGTVMTVSFQLAGQEFMSINGGPEFQFTPAVSFFVSCQTVQELDALWAALSPGGAVLMELDQYPFSERFGWLNDRFGVSWQFSLAGTPLEIAPYLLFVGDQNGHAGEAIRLYTSLFPQSSIDQLQPFPAEAGQAPGSLMHARFTLGGQHFIAMDGGLQHAFTFTPAISFFVNCLDQAEVDHLWDKLAEGGATEMCGWLRDRFGVSWQIVPTALGELLSDPDPARAMRVTQAMLQMTKLDIAGLRAA